MSRLSATIQRRDGRVLPLGPAEPADSIGMDTTLQGTMPGGQTSASLTVARDPNLRDLDPFDELVIRDAGGVEVWSGYGVEYPARDGEGPAVEISASGWSAYLKDNPPPPLVAVDRRFSAWEEPSAARQVVVLTVPRMLDQAYTHTVDRSIMFTGTEGQQITSGQTTEIWYSSPVDIAALDYKGRVANTSNVDRHSTLNVTGNNEVFAGTVSLTLDNSVRQASVSVAGTRKLQWGPYATSTHTPAAGAGFNSVVDQIAVYGNHAIPLYTNGVDGMRGVVASDVIAWGLRNACPILIPEITPSSFVIPHLVEPDLEDMEALILKVNANEMFDYGCFGRRFIYRPAGTGRTWVVRAADPGVSLTDAGTQGEDVYTRAIVSYGDFGGRSLKVGYPGSGCDTESAALVDTTNNILTQKGRPRTLRLSLSAPSTAARAAQVGQVAMEEKARQNLRGEATITGQAQDSNGVWRPVSQIQAGDQIIFADRSWTSRRIVDLGYSEETDTASISLDSTPARLDAILERMGVINESQNL